MTYMRLFIVIAFFSGVFLTIFCLYFPVLWEMISSFQKNTKKTVQKSKIKLAENLLFATGCQREGKKTRENGLDFRFIFQNGHFTMHVFPDSEQVVILFQGIYSTLLDNLDAVRSVCNYCNSIALYHTVYYEPNNSYSELYVHVSSSFYLADELDETKHVFVNLLQEFFNVRRIFTNEIEKMMLENRKQHISDAEKDGLNYQRECYMLDSMDAYYNENRTNGNYKKLNIYDFRANDDHPRHVAEFLETFLNVHPSSILRITIVADEISTLTMSADIESFDLLSPLIDRNNVGCASFKQRTATLVVAYHLSDSSDERPQIATIILDADRETDACLYVNVVISSVHVRSNGLSTSDDVVSEKVVMAYDKLDNEHRLKEFAYMRRDALEKLSAGEAASLTEDQELFDLWQNRNIAENLYWGRQCLRQERYYEAIDYLERAWNWMNSPDLEQRESHLAVFCKLSFYLGFAYFQLGLYRQAYYYLDGIFNMRNMAFSKLYVDTLVKAHDFRALYVINTLIKELREKYADGVEKMSEEEEAFMDFLRRSWAFVHLEMNDLESAEKVYKKMLDEPANADYALTQLAYIQKRKEDASLLDLSSNDSTIK